MVEIIVNTDKCDGCGECIKACNNRVLKIVEGKCGIVDSSRCKLCMLCIAYCPVKAIAIST